MPYLLVLIAQVSTDPLAGASGWAGTGLLGAILAWLLFVHLPNKDKQVSGLIDSRDKLVKELTEDFRKSLTDLVNQSENRDKERRDDFKQSLKAVTDHSEKELTTVVSEIKKDLQKVAVDVAELRRVNEGDKRGA